QPPDGLFVVVQGRTEFFLPVGGCETVFFVDFIVVFFFVCLGGFWGLPPLDMGSRQTTGLRGEGFPLFANS
ncbi:MAG: hypothetical protein KIG83_05535, partial [Treponema sp.]|nr:hypothetical protein [Treponema sp.]